MKIKPTAAVLGAPVIGTTKDTIVAEGDGLQLGVTEVESGDRMALSDKLIARGNREMLPLTDKDYVCGACKKNKEEKCICEHEDWGLFEPTCTAHEKVQCAVNLLRSKVLQLPNYEFTKQDILDAIEQTFPAHNLKDFGVAKETGRK